MSPARGRRYAAVVAACYVAAALLWIVAGDYALVKEYAIHRRMEDLATLKDAVFILASGAVLYWVLRRQFGEREAVIASLRELNRYQRMTSACENVMMRAKDREELFRGLCRAVVYSGGYRHAVVGLAQDDPGKNVAWAASAARDGGEVPFISKAKAAWADVPEGRGPTGTAIRTGEPVYLRDTEKAASLAPWKSAVAAGGFRSIVSLPLRENGAVIGALTMYSDRNDPFDEAEAALLGKLSETIDYGLDNLALRKSERETLETLRKFSRVIESSPASISITDAEARLQYVNPRFTAATGYTLDDVRGRRPWEIGLVDIGDALRAEIKALLDSGREWKGVFHSRAKDGRRFWEKVSIAPVPDGAGGASGYIAVKEDITAQLALDRAYRMSAACDAAIIRARTRQELLDAVCRIAVNDGDYILAWAGLTRGDGKSGVVPVARFGPDDGLVDELTSSPDAGLEPGAEAARTGRIVVCPGNGDAPRPCCERDRLWGLRSSVALPLREGGRTVGSLTLYSDRADAPDDAEMAILEKMAATLDYALGNLASRENEREQVDRLRRLSHAVESSPASIVITDATGVIQYVNRKFTEVSGYSAEEMRGRNPRLLKSGEVPPETYRDLWATISSGREWHGELTNVSKDGRTFVEWASISPVRDGAGNITHYIAIKEDITGRRGLEQQLRQAQKMEAVGTLAGGIAHDFNNLLTVIQGHALLLQSSAASADARESVDEIIASAERAAVLTRQLLAFSRRQPYHPRRVDAGEAVQRMGRMLRRLLPENAELTIQVPEAPLFAHADPAMLDQVLMNLVLNAKDSLPRTGGRITVELAARDAAAPGGGADEHAPGWARLTVTDDGCGIPAENIARIFEPFFTTKAAGKGSGLGLAVVDGIVRQHKGWVDVKSAVGKGSAFSAHFPLAAPDAAAAEPAASGPVPHGTETILFAEDEGALRRMSARFLRSLGYTVLEAPNGDAAAAAWDERPGDAKIRLLITDIVMPGRLNGGALARRLRGDAPDLRILYISGYQPAATADDAPLDRAFFLQKPFRPDDLARRVRALLDHA